MSEEALQIVEERREATGNGEREKYTHLNSEIQRTALRDKKDFLNEQCKEIEENNRMKMTRDLLKKIGDVKRTFHTRMGMIKDRKGKFLTEVAKIRKKWQEYREELYKQGLNDLDNYDGVVVHLELDILECEVRWASGNISTNKASRSDGILAELFKILKGNTCFSAALNMSANLENSAVITGLEKVSFQSNP